MREIVELEVILILINNKSARLQYFALLLCNITSILFIESGDYFFNKVLTILHKRYNMQLESSCKKRGVDAISDE